MSKANRNFGIFLATTFGVLTAYVTWRPELEAQRAERLGYEVPKRGQADNAISEQIRGDFREAGKEWEQDGGFAWGIRKALRGRNPFAKPSEGARVQKVEGNGQDDGRSGKAAEGEKDAEKEE